MSKGKKQQKPGKVAPLVGVIMGSDTDLPVMSETIKTLKEFGLPYEVEVTSAHRSPDRTHHYAKTALGRGLKVIIVGAGGASHLAGGGGGGGHPPALRPPARGTAHRRHLCGRNHRLVGRAPGRAPPPLQG